MDINVDCTGCDAICCKNISSERRVIVFPEDVLLISNNLKIKAYDFLQRFCYNDKEKLSNGDSIDVYYLNATESKECIFLKNNLCSIHEYKPFQCRKTPFNFLWSGERLYSCMDTISVPINFSTVESDKKLFESLSNGYNFK